MPQISFNQAPAGRVQSGSVHKHLPCPCEFDYRAHVKMPGVMVYLCNPKPGDVENEDLWSSMVSESSAIPELRAAERCVSKEVNGIPEDNP